MELQDVFDVYRGNLAKTLLMVSGQKYLFMEKSLLTCIDRLCTLQFLKSYGVEKMYHLTDVIPKELSKVIIIIPPEPKDVKTVISILRHDHEKDITREILIVLSPMITISAEYLLTQSGFIGNRVRLSELDLTWIALDEDLLCTSWHNSNLLKSGCFNTSYCLSHPTSVNQALEVIAPSMAASTIDNETQGDTTWPYQLGYAVGQILTMGLKFSVSNCQLYGLGNCVAPILQGINQHCQDMGGTAINAKGAKGYAMNQSPLLFIFGREVDYITPFLLPVTYEALLHEIMPFELDTQTFPRDMLEGSEDKKVTLNSIDPVYKEIRGLPISEVHSALRQMNRTMDEKADAVKSSGGTVQDYREFVVGGHMQALLHQRSVISCLFAGLEAILKKMTILERVDDLMQAQWDILLGQSDELALQLAREWLSKGMDGLLKGLRILCLASCVADGLPDPVYQEFARLVCQCGGHVAVYLLYELKRLHLLEPKSYAETAIIHPNNAANNVGGVPKSSSSSVLQSVTKGGVKSAFREKANLFLGQKIRSSRQNTIQKYLQLLPGTAAATQDVNRNNCAAYAFANQYTPPISRLLEEFAEYSFQSPQQNAISNNVMALRWQNLDASVRLLSVSSANGLPACRLSLRSGSRNPHFVTAQGQNSAADPQAAENSNVPPAEYLRMKQNSTLKHHGRIVMVLMAGGCSYAELASLRRLAEANHWRLLILTTALLGTTDLIIQSA